MPYHLHTLQNINTVALVLKLFIEGLSIEVEPNAVKIA